MKLIFTNEMEDSEVFYYIWEENAISIALQLSDLIEKYSYFRSHFRKIKCNNNAHIIIKSWLGFIDERRSHYYEIGEFTKCLLIMAASTTDISTEKCIYTYFSVLLKRLFNLSLREPSFNDVHTISYLSKITGITMDHSQVILERIKIYIQYKRRFKEWNSPELLTYASDIHLEYDKYEIECFRYYFGNCNNITFYVKLALLCASSLSRIVSKYEFFEDWLNSKNLEECSEKLNEPLVILFLCTYHCQYDIE